MTTEDGSDFVRLKPLVLANVRRGFTRSSRSPFRCGHTCQLSMVTIGAQQAHLRVSAVRSSLGLKITTRLGILYQASPIKQAQHRRGVPMSLAVTYLPPALQGIGICLMASALYKAMCWKTSLWWCSDALAVLAISP